MSKRSRGGQSGNRNAVKHGLYSATFKEHERRLLSQLPAGRALGNEIDAIRVVLRRYLAALSAAPDSDDLETQLAALRAVNRSAQSISSLLRAQALIRFPSDLDPNLVPSCSDQPSSEPSAAPAPESSALTKQR
ncbi:MAG: hypothetical protein ACM3MF_00585 [Anaerolineae bacterium]